MAKKNQYPYSKQPNTSYQPNPVPKVKKPRGNYQLSLGLRGGKGGGPSVTPPKVETKPFSTKTIRGRQGNLFGPSGSPTVAAIKSVSKAKAANYMRMGKRAGIAGLVIGAGVAAYQANKVRTKDAVKQPSTPTPKVIAQPNQVKSPAAPKSTPKASKPVKMVGSYPVYKKDSEDAAEFRKAFKAAKGANFMWRGREYSGKRK